jgi:hypothetical protein
MFYKKKKKKELKPLSVVLSAGSLRKMARMSSTQGSLK